MAMNWPRLYAIAPPRNASVIRNSGDVSSTPISADELNSVRTIVLANTMSTWIASVTLSRTSAAESIAFSHAGTPCSYAGASSPMGFAIAVAASLVTLYFLLRPA